MSQKSSLWVGLGMIGAAIGLGSFVLSQRKTVSKPPVRLALGMGYELIATQNDGSGEFSWKLVRDGSINVAQGTAPTFEAAMNLGRDALKRDLDTVGKA